MKKKIYLSILSLAILGLLGCAATPQQGAIKKKETEAGSLAAVKHIAVLEIPNPPFYWMGEGDGSATAAFGVIGMMAEYNNAGSNSHLYGDFDFSTLTENRLLDGLKAQGYLATVVNAPREPGKEVTLLKSYDVLDAGEFDAYLDLVPMAVGFRGSNALTLALPDLGPHVTVVARLVSSKSFEVLYSETISYGYQKQPFTTQIELPEGQDDYDNVNELKANIEKATGELEAGVFTVADAIIERLAKEND